MDRSDSIQWISWYTFLKSEIFLLQSHRNIRWTTLNHSIFEWMSEAKQWNKLYSNTRVLLQMMDTKKIYVLNKSENGILNFVSKQFWLDFHRMKVQKNDILRHSPQRLCLPLFELNRRHTIHFISISSTLTESCKIHIKNILLWYVMCVHQIKFYDFNFLFEKFIELTKIWNYHFSINFIFNIFSIKDIKSHVDKFDSNKIWRRFAWRRYKKFNTQVHSVFVFCKQYILWQCVSSLCLI